MRFFRSESFQYFFVNFRYILAVFLSEGTVDCIQNLNNFLLNEPLINYITKN